MKERLKKYAPYAVYPVFYVVCLVVFAVLTFPFDKLKERLVTSFNAQQRATNGTQSSVSALTMKDVSALGDKTQAPDLKAIAPVISAPRGTEPAIRVAISPPIPTVRGTAASIRKAACHQ